MQVFKKKLFKIFFHFFYKHMQIKYDYVCINVGFLQKFLQKKQKKLFLLSYI